MTGAAPFFVVGCPRSGTTLLRLMLTSHPDLAVPPETHFIPELAPSRRRRQAVGVEEILRHPRVAAWGLDAGAVRDLRAADPPESYAATLDRVFTAYAHAHGKARWGDKTPGYVEHLPLLAGLFPDARFVHIIRDGRLVAASLAEQPWGPGGAVLGAFWWVTKVRRGRRAGERLGADRYLEIRHEHLAQHPEDVLRTVCAFLDVAYDPAMLEYPDRVPIVRPGHVPSAKLALPPTPGLRDWRVGLTPRDHAAVEAVCGPLLADLGYPTGPRSLAALAHAWRLRSQGLASGYLRARPRERHGASPH